MEIPIISIITPVFNAIEFLPETLRSVQEQTLQDWEHILVDDGSTDGSVELIRSAAACDPRIRLLSLSACAGPARARNSGLNKARGGFVAFLDADDLWLPPKLERCVAWLKLHDYTFVYHDYRHMSRDGKKIGALITGPSRLDFRTLHTRRGHGGCMSIVLNRAKLPDFCFPVDHNYLHEDFVAWLQLMKKGHVGHRLPEDLGRYRVSKTSRSGRKIAAAVECWRIYVNESQLHPTQALSWWMQYAWRSYWMHWKATPR